MKVFATIIAMSVTGILPVSGSPFPADLATMVSTVRNHYQEANNTISQNGTDYNKRSQKEKNDRVLSCKVNTKVIKEGRLHTDDYIPDALWTIQFSDSNIPDTKKEGAAKHMESKFCQWDQIPKGPDCVCVAEVAGCGYNADEDRMEYQVGTFLGPLGKDCAECLAIKFREMMMRVTHCGTG